jgi:hypothetical protein
MENLVSEAQRIPFIRLARPYGSEKEFLDGDFGWLGRTTVILPNGPARAAGELVRFELVLTSGAPILRGEGHVVAHHSPGGPKPPGLEVRFTRVDAKSKVLLDRVRERRNAMSQPGSTSLLPAQSLLPLQSLLPSQEPSSQEPALSRPPHSNGHSVPTPPTTLGSPRRGTHTPSERSGMHLTRAASKIAPPANRDDILERLRTRARQRAAAGGPAYKKAGLSQG